MTAEVGILNRLGVALAADSAVSIGREANKIWTSADKLFHLSRTAPVGAMIYGNANFVGIPWETIVKEFRVDLGTTRFDTLSAYADRFFRFLSRSSGLLPKSAQDATTSETIRSLFLDARQDVESTLTREAEKRDGLDEAEIGPIVDEYVAKRLAYIRTQPFLSGFGPQVRRTVRERYRAVIRQLRGHVFGKLPLSSATSRRIASMANEMLVRSYMGPGVSGVVVAGFGDREAMPSLLAYQVEEMAAGRPRRFLNNETHITRDSAAAIVPFAQQEMVHAFLRGVEEHLAQHMRVSTTKLFEGTVGAILEEVGKADEKLKTSLKVAIEPALEQALRGLFQDWESQTVRHWSPVVDIVASLPKDELAAMAEALVNLTKFRRRITPERETVGGPIDVAVISKGDGFVWVKRKHYFDSALNPRVMARYGKEV